MRIVIILIILMMTFTACQSSGDASRFSSRSDSEPMQEALDVPDRLPVNKPTKVLITDVLSTLTEEDMSTTLLNGNPGKVIKHGRTYTLKGNNFEYKSPVEPLLWDTVANQEAYEGLTHHDQIPIDSDSVWAYSSCRRDDYACDFVRYWMDNARVSDSASYAFPTGPMIADPVFYDSSDFLYWSVWVKSDDAYQTMDSKRLFALSRYGSDYDDRGYFNVYDGRIDYAALDEPYGGYDYFVMPEDDDWHRFEISLDTRNGIGLAGQGIFYVAIDGVKVSEGSNLYMPANSAYGDMVSLGHYMYGYNSPIVEYNLYMSEMYVDNSPAKLMICDAPIFADVQHCELQKPVDMWNKQTIKFVANQGSFDHQAQVYVYVQTPKGLVNAAGYAIRVVGEPDIILPDDSCADDGLTWLTSDCAVGYVNGELYEICDTCSDGFTLEEVTCEGDISGIEIHPCTYPDGTPAPCVNGACIDDSCVETDSGLDYGLKGDTVGFIDGVWTEESDECRGAATNRDIIEWYCDGNDLLKDVEDCPVFCWDGACVDEVVPPSIPCVDTDGGRMPANKGSVTGIGDFYWRYPDGREVTFTDKCNTIGIAGLTEYYCDEFGYVAEVGYRDSDGCNCLNGECTGIEDPDEEWSACSNTFAQTCAEVCVDAGMTCTDTCFRGDYNDFFSSALFSDRDACLSERWYNAGRTDIGCDGYDTVDEARTRCCCA